MVSKLNELIELQAKEHPLIRIDQFASVQEYVLHLIHQRDYEEVIPFCRGKTVLDFGCNNGYGTNLLATVAKSTIGIDVSETALEDARRRFPHLILKLVDGVSLPFEAGSFDVVVSFQVIEHILDVTKYLEGIVRVLKPQGVAIFTTPNAAIRLDPGMTPWNRFHTREYNADELRSVLGNSFTKVEVKGMFAVGEAYEIEYQRSQRALQDARAVLASGGRRKEQKLNRLTKRIASRMPSGMIGILRQGRDMLLQKTEKRTFGSEDLKRFGTSDFFYRGQELTRALDLMAICSKAS